MFKKLTILLFIFSSILQISTAISISTDDHTDDVLEEISIVTYTYAIYERELDDLDQKNTKVPLRASTAPDLQSMTANFCPIFDTDTFVPSIFPPPEQPIV